MSMQIDPYNIQFMGPDGEVTNTTAFVIVIMLITGGISQAGDYYVFLDAEGRTWLSNHDPTAQGAHDVTILDRYQWQDGPNGHPAGAKIEAPPKGPK
jgi:hypothetical protein